MLVKIKFLKSQESLWKQTVSRMPLYTFCTVCIAVTVGPQQCPGSMLVLIKLPELALVNISRRGITDPPALTHQYNIN